MSAARSLIPWEPGDYAISRDPGRILFRVELVLRDRDEGIGLRAPSCPARARCPGWKLGSLGTRAPTYAAFYFRRANPSEIRELRGAPMRPCLWCSTRSAKRGAASRR